MTRLALSLIVVAALCSSPALARITPPAPEPISVAVAPPDDGIPEIKPPPVPTAESKATPAGPKPPMSGKPDDESELDYGKIGIDLKIDPFGWRIPLISRQP